jgi:hypothetical protein
LNPCAHTSDGDAWPGSDGTVFRIDREGGIEVLLPFDRFFFQASDGFFHGTTTGDGGSEAGAVFRMDATAVRPGVVWDPLLASRSPRPRRRHPVGPVPVLRPIPPTEDGREAHRERTTRDARPRPSAPGAV